MAQLTTAPTPSQSGRWVVPRFGVPSVLTWQPLAEGSIDGPITPARLEAIPKTLTGTLALIRIITAGAGGVDNIQRAGGYPDPRTAQPGFTPGYEFVGEVIGLGPDAAAAYAKEVNDPSATLRVGDRVTSMCVIGAHATHTVIEAAELFKLHPNDDPVKVAALPLNYMTAYGMLRRSPASLTPGSTILVGSAAGGVGSALAQLVHAFDMGIKMIGTCSPPKMDYVRSLGMTPVNRLSADLVAEVSKLTDGKGVDVAYDAVGSKESLATSLAATKGETGQVILIGIMDEILSDGSGMRRPGADAREILADRLGERTSFWGVQRGYYDETRQLFRQDFNDILQRVREGKLTPEISKLYKLSEAIEVNELLVHGGGVKGKMVYVIDGELARTKALSS